MKYHCNCCNISICSDCLIFENNHKEHDIIKLETIYQNRIKSINNYIETLNNKINKSKNKLNLLDKKVRDCIITKEEVFY